MIQRLCVAVLLAACAARRTTPITKEHAVTAPQASTCQGEGELLRYRETTNPTLSQREVGIANIYSRDLPDDQGKVAPRISAMLVIHDPATDDTKRETVFAGSVVDIGADRYCVVSVEEGHESPGWVSLRRL